MLERHIVLSIVLFLVALSPGLSQDIHYSQFYMHYPGQSPVHAGAYKGEHRITANYRSQWQTVPVPYLSLSLFYDSKFKFKTSKDFIGVGIGLDYDRAGDSKLSLTSLNAAFNYGLNLKKNHLIVLGISPSIGQRRFSEEKLKWDNQWNGDRYDPNLSPRESFSTTGSFFFDLGAGISYQYSKSARSYLMIGASAFHLLQPDQSFYGLNQTKTELPLRPVVHAELSIGLVPFADLILNAQHQQQDQYKESTGAGMFRFYINKNPGVRFNLLAGCGLRLDDAFFPIAGFQYQNWMATASYDINTSDFKTATNQRGGLELAVQYLFRSVEPVGLYKKCPIY